MVDFNTYQFQLDLLITRFSHNKNGQFYEEDRKSTSFWHREEPLQRQRSIGYLPFLRGSATTAAIQENDASAVKVERFYNWFAASPLQRLLAMTKIRRYASSQKQCGKIMTTPSQIDRW